MSKGSCLTRPAAAWAMGENRVSIVARLDATAVTKEDAAGRATVEASVCGGCAAKEPETELHLLSDLENGAATYITRQALICLGVPDRLAFSSQRVRIATQAGATVDA